MEHRSCVQFRGLSSHYKPRDPIKVAVRYAVGGKFSAALGDTIGVFPENASTTEEALLSVSVEQPSSHRLCDGGLYRASSVTLNLPEAAEQEGDTTGSSKKYRVWYICAGTGEAVGKSGTFTVCASGVDYPMASVPFGSMDDQAVHTLSDSISTSYVDAGEQLNTSSALDSSFVLVSEGSSCGSEYLVSPRAGEQKSLEGGSESVCIVASAGDDVTGDVISDSRKEGRGHLHSRQEAGLREADASPGPMDDYAVCQPLTNTDTPSESGKPADSALPPDPLKTDITPAVEPSGSDESSRRSMKRCLELSSPVSYYSTGLSLALEPPEVVDMSCSTVIIEKFITQREARMLKSANKDSRVKIHKLSEILEEKMVDIANLTKALGEKEGLLSTVGESERRFEAAEKGFVDAISSLQEKVVGHRTREKEQKRQTQDLQGQLERSESTRKRTESLNKKLLIEKSALEARVKQLSKDNRTVLDRSSKLLTQLQDCETKRGIEKSEKQVLQVKIDYLGTELRKIKAAKLLDAATTSAISGGGFGAGGVAPHPAGGHHRSADAKSKPPRGGPEMMLMPQAGTLSKRPNELHLGHPRESHDMDRRELANIKQRALPQSNFGPKPAVTVRDQQVLAKPEREPVAARIHDHSGRDRLPDMQGDVRMRRGGDNSSYETLQLPGEASHIRAGTGNVNMGGHQWGVEGPGLGGIGNNALDTLADVDETGRVLAGVGVGVAAAAVIECPICGKELRPSRSKEKDFSVMMHVEHCIQLSEMSSPRDV